MTGPQGHTWWVPYVAEQQVSCSCRREHTAHFSVFLPSYCLPPLFILFMTRWSTQECLKLPLGSVLREHSSRNSGTKCAFVISLGLNHSWKAFSSLYCCSVLSFTSSLDICLSLHPFPSYMPFFLQHSYCRTLEGLSLNFDCFDFKVLSSPDAIHESILSFKHTDCPIRLLFFSQQISSSRFYITLQRSLEPVIIQSRIKCLTPFWNVSGFFEDHLACLMWRFLCVHRNVSDYSFDPLQFEFGASQGPDAWGI